MLISDWGSAVCSSDLVLRLAAVVGVLQPRRDRLLGDAEDRATGVVIARGLLENLLGPTAGRHTTFDSCHCSALLREMEACDRDGLRVRHERGSSAGGYA